MPFGRFCVSELMLSQVGALVVKISMTGVYRLGSVEACRVKSQRVGKALDLQPAPARYRAPSRRCQSVPPRKREKITK
jgi:hypothetical protein